MKKLKAVFLDQAPVRPQDLSWNLLEQAADCHYHAETNADEVCARAQQADIIITNKVQLTRSHLKALPNLKLICISATGVNNVDLEAAQDLGVAVTNVAGYSTESVVQYTFSLLLDLMSKSVEYAEIVRQGAWQKTNSFCLTDFKFHELAGKTLVIIGWGHIGQRVAAVARAFGMEIIVAARREQKDDVPQGRVRFEEALQQADVVSVHCPLLPETKGLIAEAELALMKSGAYLLNVSRGGIVDENALAEALKTQKIAGAALDVLEAEPPQSDVRNPLLDLAAKRYPLIITPHVAWASVESRQRLIDELAANIRAFASGELRNRVV